MPRRNKPVKHTPFHIPLNEKGKVRYGTKKAAEQAAQYRMVEHPELELTVYQALNGGWYLTRQIHKK